jgi:hypothetical protein
MTQPGKNKTERFLSWHLLLTAVWLLCFHLSAIAQLSSAYEEEPISYSTAETSNHADFLSLAIQAMPDKQLPQNGRKALDRLLDEFSVPVESQVLVFTKTSLQRNRIHPSNPRALYFSEDAYIGYVPGGILELILHDPDLGIVFYEVRPRTQTISRSRDCLGCHGGSRTDHWPGVFIRSVYPHPDGNPITSTGSYLTTHESPISERWGGWYVTGKHGKARHLGNLTISDPKTINHLDLDAGANVSTLSRYFDTSKYPLDTSDIVSLMVLEHQCEMHNRLSRGMLRTRKWMKYQQELDRSLGRKVASIPTGTALTVVRGETERIVDYLLYRGEAALPDEGIGGSKEFQKAFRGNRKEDSQGRSLKDFDLQRRLFKYRCSYMIYSKAFDSLPDHLENAVFKQLVSVLRSEARRDRFENLSKVERATILEILTETKPEIRPFL